MTVSLSAVFIPVLFMGGIVGRLLQRVRRHHRHRDRRLGHRLGDAHADAVRPPDPSSRKRTAPSARTFYRCERSVLRRDAARLRAHAAGGASGIAASSSCCSRQHRRDVVLFRVMPQDFLPSEDTGQLTATTEGANGISFEEMRRHQDEAAQILCRDPNIEGAMSSVGSGGARGGSNQGSFRITLKPTDERAADRSGDGRAAPQIRADPGPQRLHPEPPRRSPSAD